MASPIAEPRRRAIASSLFQQGAMVPPPAGASRRKCKILRRRRVRRRIPQNRRWRRGCMHLRKQQPQSLAFTSYALCAQSEQRKGT